MLEISGAGSRVRTRDPLITNQVLYQLSYTGIVVAFSIEWGGRTTGKNEDRSLERSLAARELFFCQLGSARIAQCGGQGAWGGLSYALPHWCTNLPQGPVAQGFRTVFGLMVEGVGGYETRAISADRPHIRI